MQSPLKILFIDDHAGLRDSLCFLLSQNNSNFNFITGSTYNEGIELLKQNEDISLAIIDINLDGSNGIQLISDLRKINSQLSVIIYSMYNDPLHIEESLKANIQGYITKDAKIEELEEAINSVNKGNSYFNRQAQKIIYSLLNGNSTNQSFNNNDSYYLFTNYKMLTKKEQEIFSLLAQKKETWEIAEILGKSEKTVINQKSNIYQKMNFKDRLDVVEAAKMLGVIL